jgi:hypothetical protein
MMDDLAKFGYNWDVKVKNFKHTAYYIFLATIWYRNLNILYFILFFSKFLYWRAPKSLHLDNFNFQVLFLAKFSQWRKDRLGHG